MSQTTSPSSPDRSAGLALFWLRAVHTAVFAVCISCIGVVAVYDITGLGRAAALWALVPPGLVFCGLVLNRGECILQTMARRLAGQSDPSVWVRDVFWLPQSWALRVVPVLVPVSIILLGVMMARLFL